MKDRKMDSEQCARELSELLKTNEFLSLILDSMTVAVYTSRAGGDFGTSYISNNITLLTGYEPEEFTSDSEFWFRNIHTDDQDMVNKNLATLLETGYITYEYRWRVSDGSYRWFYDISKLITSDDTGYIIGTWIDITRRKKAEEALRESEEKYHSLVDSLQEGIWVVDKDDKTTFVNKRMSEMLGYSVDEMIGKKVFAFMDEQGKELCNYYLERRKKGINEQHDFELIKKNGDRIYVTMESSSINDKDGKYISGVAGVIDITKRRKAEEALKKAKNEIEEWSKELEKRVREKSEEVSRSQNHLIHAEKLSAMGQLAGGLAHELNSPLSGLIMMIKGKLKEATKGPDDYDDLTLMLNAADHMGRIMKDFGGFSRKSKGEFTPICLNEAIENTLSFSGVRMKQKGGKVDTQLADDLPLVNGNKTEIQQVVLNMITNAGDAMPEGGELRIKTYVSNDGNEVMMQFVDNGIGIEKENIDKIFNSFFTTKKEGDGIGLGLFVSYGIIEKHGGRISVKSEPGKGTEFLIHLPVHK